MDRDDMFDTGATVATAAGIRQARRKFFRKVYRTLYSGVPKRIGPVIALGSILNRFTKTAADEASQAPNPLNTPFAHRLYAGGAVASGAALGIGNRILNQATKPTTAYVKYAIGDARGAKKSYDLASDLIANREKAVDYLKKNPGAFSSSYGEALNYNLDHFKTKQQQYLKEYNAARKAVGDNFKAYQNARKNYKIMSQKGKMLRSIGKAGLAASIAPAALGYFMDRNTKTASSNLPALYRLKQSINKKEKTAAALAPIRKMHKGVLQDMLDYKRMATAGWEKQVARNNIHDIIGGIRAGEAAQRASKVAPTATNYKAMMDASGIRNMDSTLYKKLRHRYGNI